LGLTDLNVRAWLARALVAWGALSLLSVIAFAGYLAYHYSRGHHVEIDTATTKDVRFVLNWCGLGEDRIEKVVHSYVTSRNVTGDHVDAYAIKISNVELKELTAREDDFGEGWHRADTVPPVLNDAIAFMGTWLHQVSWFPSEAELRTSDYYVYPWSIYTQGVRPTATELIFVRPRDNMVFYFSGKT